MTTEHGNLSGQRIGTNNDLLFEGNKIYFKNKLAEKHTDDPNNWWSDIKEEFKEKKEEQGNGEQEWLLMYDFGLEIGEETDIYTYLLPGLNERYYVRTHVKRIERPDNWEDVDPDCIFLIETPVDSLDSTEGEIIWWKPGVGSQYGFRWNATYGDKGSKPELREASLDSDVLYSAWPKKELSFNNHIVPGLKWTYQSWGCMDRPNEMPLAHLNLGAEIEFEGEKVMPISYGEIPSDEIWAYVRTEGNKVYVRSPKEGENAWYLFYDFGLQPGEGARVSVIGSNFPPVNTSYIKCIDRYTTEENPGCEIMLVEEYGKYTLDDVTFELMEGRGEWIAGIGSVDGFNSNTYFEADGGGSKLREASCGEQILYSNWNGYSQINEVGKADSAFDFNIDGLTLTASSATETEASVYDLFGNLIARFRATAEPSCVILPAKGLYLLQVGDKAQKIFVK